MHFFASQFNLTKMYLFMLQYSSTKLMHWVAFISRSDLTCISFQIMVCIKTTFLSYVCYKTITQFTKKSFSWIIQIVDFEITAQEVSLCTDKWLLFIFCSSVHYCSLTVVIKSFTACRSSHPLTYIHYFLIAQWCVKNMQNNFLYTELQQQCFIVFIA